VGCIYFSKWFVFTHTGLGLQGNVFIVNDLGCGFNLETVVGLGGANLKENKSAVVVALAPIIKVFSNI